MMGITCDSGHQSCCTVMLRASRELRIIKSQKDQMSPLRSDQSADLCAAQYRLRANQVLFRTNRSPRKTAVNQGL
jgi:hypothetical protein